MPWQPGQSASGQTTLLPEVAFLEVANIIFVISRDALEIFLGISVFRLKQTTCWLQRCTRSGSTLLLLHSSRHGCPS